MFGSSDAPEVMFDDTQVAWSGDRPQRVANMQYASLYARVYSSNGIEVPGSGESSSKKSHAGETQMRASRSTLRMKKNPPAADLIMRRGSVRENSVRPT